MRPTKEAEVSEKEAAMMAKASRNHSWDLLLVIVVLVVICFNFSMLMRLVR